MSRIAVIGGSGFIGTELVKLLIESGDEVSIIDIEESAAYPELFVRGDVRDRVSLGQLLKGCDIVYNLAAVHRDDVRPVDLYFDVNVKGAQALVDACADVGLETLIFTSSVAVYAPAPKEIDETGATKPISPYGTSKLAAEEVYRKWQTEADGRHLVVVRPTVVFGEGNRGNVYNLARQIVDSRFLMVGSGKNRKSMAFVTNLAHFLAGIPGREKQGVEVINYADKPDLSMNDLVALMHRTLDRKQPALRLPLVVGLLAGGLVDVVSRTTGRRFPISASRIRKFCSWSVFSSDHRWRSEEGVVPLADAVAQTLKREFGTAAKQ
jgi:GlcNAc-P-P-Und epimerase